MNEGRVYVGLGSNLGNPALQVERAMDALAAEPGMTVLKRSSLYKTEPIGLAGQPDYINAVVEIATTLAPFNLLDALKRIETACGRVRNGEFWGARVIDLDLLLYKDECIEDRRLRVPHPEMASRRFVLLPLQEIAPGLIIPGEGRLEDLIRQAPRYRVTPLPNVAVQ